MLTPDTEDELIESFDELRTVCQALIAVFVENRQLEVIDATLFARGIVPGFAERADKVRKMAMMERFHATA